MSTGDHRDLPQILMSIDAAACDYTEWVQCGMALHKEGFGVDVWDDWSRTDPGRYKQGECAQKWRGFDGTEAVGAGTIVHIAEDHGWERPGRRDPKALRPSGTFKVDFWEPELDRAPVRSDVLSPVEFDVEASADGWDGMADMRGYLMAVFEPGDMVNCVTEARDGRPSAKGFTRERDELLAALDRGHGYKGVLLPMPSERDGAWVRVNPTNGRGVTNNDVTAFRHALVESDSMPVGEQLAVIRELRLPCSAIVYSGGKSVHAVVKVDAPSRAEYDRRVSFLYDFCERRGLRVDRQNSNPARLSRLPGVARAGRRQSLVRTDMGMGTWAEWEAWAIAEIDGLPDIVNLADVMGDLPPLAPEVIQGVLRRGHKMLLAGPSKASKSFCLMGLAVAASSGTQWLGMDVAKGRVLYVNLEIDQASSYHRFADIAKAKGLGADALAGIDVWGLRGHSQTMDKLAPRLINKCATSGYDMVIIDPIYKVMMGDENAAGDMAAFCNEFDRIATHLGCAVIYAHHHSKAAQMQSVAMNRASGSGVFARDPDALLDMSPLAVPDEAYHVLGLCKTKRWAKWKWPKEFFSCGAESADPAQVRERLSGVLELRDLAEYDMQAALICEETRRARPPGFVIETTLREFPTPLPRHVWFEYPVHVPDTTGILPELKRAGSPGRPRDFDGSKDSEGKTKRLQREKNEALGRALEKCEADQVPATIENVRMRIGEVDGKVPTKTTLRNWVRPEVSKWSDFILERQNGVSVIKEASL